MARTLERKLAEAGFDMLDSNKKIEVLILSLLEEKDIRHLKAIPFLIYLHHPDLSRLSQKTKQKALLGEMIAISRKIFKEEGIDQALPLLDSKIHFNYQEFKEEFLLQKSRREGPLFCLDKKKIYAERNLQLFLSYLFTKKERFIMESIFAQKPLTKTEYEYYSRKTKKKLNAITQLHDFANSLLPLSPLLDKKNKSPKR